MPRVPYAKWIPEVLDEIERLHDLPEPLGIGHIEAARRFVVNFSAWWARPVIELCRREGKLSIFIFVARRHTEGYCCTNTSHWPENIGVEITPEMSFAAGCGLPRDFENEPSEELRRKQASQYEYWRSWSNTWKPDFEEPEPDVVRHGGFVRAAYD